MLFYKILSSLSKNAIVTLIPCTCWVLMTPLSYASDTKQADKPVNPSQPVISLPKSSAVICPISFPHISPLRPLPLIPILDFGFWILDFGLTYLVSESISICCSVTELSSSLAN